MTKILGQIPNSILYNYNTTSLGCNKEIYINMIQVAKIIGTGMATTGLIGAGVGIGVVFGILIFCLYDIIIQNTVHKMPGVRCSRC